MKSWPWTTTAEPTLRLGLTVSAPVAGGSTLSASDFIIGENTLNWQPDPPVRLYFEWLNL